MVMLPEKLRVLFRRKMDKEVTGIVFGSLVCVPLENKAFPILHALFDMERDRLFSVHNLLRMRFRTAKLGINRLSIPIAFTPRKDLLSDHRSHVNNADTPPTPIAIGATN
jgi:hypothetical protein